MLSCTDTADNPLLGTWEHDKELTLNSVMFGSPPEKVRLCYEKEVCGNFSIEYKKNTFRISQHAIDDVSEFGSYRIVPTLGKTIIVEGKNESGELERTVWTIKADVGCFPLEFEGYKYNECFRRKSQ